VVMLDFTQYAAPYSPKRIMELRNLYQKYSSRGFEIYQVSLDGDESFWKTSCERLPWICVFDPDGGASDNVKNYRVTSMPEYFLINRNNELVARSTGIPNLAKSIEKLLAK
jgi:alkyl hydroperoxide reductase subunit AhpC